MKFWGRPTPNLYVYLICAVFLGRLFIIIIFNPYVNSNSEDRVSKSTEDLIHTNPQSKDCCFFEMDDLFQLDCIVRKPCSKGACEWKQKIICHG